MSQLATVELSNEHAKAWEQTRAALLWHCPAFAHILYTLMQSSGTGSNLAMFTEDEQIPIAATDGKTLIIRPSTFFALTLNERVFVAAHEIAHCIFDHMALGHQCKQRGKVVLTDGSDRDYDHGIMNQAMDYVINDLLIESKVGSFPTMGLHDKAIGTANDSVIDVYGKLFDDQQKNGGKGNQQGKSGFDAHLAPGTSQGQDPHTANSGRSPQEWKTQVAAAAQAAKLQGKLPAGLERLLQEVLDPVVSWQDLITGFFARKVGSGRYNWKTADRRLIVRDIVAPGRMGNGAGPIVVAIDTSGSIGDKELSRFFAEMGGILEDVRPELIYVMFCDAAVGAVVEVHDPLDLSELRKQKAPGGGGTAFEPVFDEIAKMGVSIDCLVYLTDGYGSFPKKAPGDYPVLWGDISGGNAKYPWGDVIQVPLT